MAWVQQHGGRILDDEGKPALNTPENVEILKFFGELFNYAPPGSTDYWWDQRETAFRTGNVAMMEGWSIARAGYENPEISTVVGNVDIRPRRSRRVWSRNMASAAGASASTPIPRLRSRSAPGSSSSG
jgi:multiple sugar transport system substrate-binding protein